MAFANALSKAGHVPQEISTTAVVTLGPEGAGFKIQGIELRSEGTVAGIDEGTFQKIAEEAKQTCPVSRALSATPITLKATLRAGARTG